MSTVDGRVPTSAEVKALQIDALAAMAWLVVDSSAECVDDAWITIRAFDAARRALEEATT